MKSPKFLPPRPVRSLERERLLNRLVQWQDKRLVIIHGQAGQGKSTLAAAYAASLSIPSAWYTMDRDDDNPCRFLQCLGQSLQQALPDLFSLIPAVASRHAGTGDIIEEARRWLRRISPALRRPCMIVFDDAGAAAGYPVVKQLFEALIREMPPTVRFMLLSRSRPDLDLTALRMKQEVAELANEDLRFTDAEVQELFGAVFGMQVSEREAGVINRTAEGWAAGLVLMHEYRASASPDSWAAVKEQGNHIFDYLAQEVFSHLPGDLRKFLVSTSVTDILPFELMQPLTGLPSATTAQIVEELQKRNLFTTPVSGGIRYHSLFRDFLQKKLPTLSTPRERGRLSRVASEFFKRSGDGIRAVDLLLASEQYGKALPLIESCTPALIAQGQGRTLLRWQEAMPPEHRNTPWFLLCRAVTLRFSDPVSAVDLLDRSLKAFSCDSTVRLRTEGQMLSLCGIIEACFHSGRDFPLMGRAAVQAQALLASTKTYSAARARLLLAMGMAWFFTGKLEQSTSALSRALELFRKQGDAFHQITSTIYLAPCALYQGEFSLAREALRKGFEAHALIPHEMGGKAALLLTSAMTALFEGNFSEAQERIEECRKLSDALSLESIDFLSLNIGGWLKIAQGEYAGAVLLLKECKRRGEAAGNSFFSASAAHLLAIASLFQNRLDLAEKESGFALAVPARSRSILFHAIYLIANGAIHLKRRRYGLAEKELLTAARTLGRLKASQQEANAHLMLSVLYFKRSRPEAARKHLRLGFSIGRELGFTYYALLTSKELAVLAGKALAENICADYCAGLLDRRRSPGSPLLAIHCMGEFKVYRGRTLVTDGQWKSKRAKQLLKLLLAHDGQKLPREQAMEMLWPRSESEDLRRMFNSMLHRVRKVLEPEPMPGKDIFCIHREGDLIALDPDRVWTDVREFLSRVEGAARLRSEGKQKELLEEYERAAGLYKGDFLPEDLYTDWTNEMRDRLRARYFGLLGDAAALADSLGEPAKAAQFYDRLFLVDPTNEKVCRWLMTRHLAAGQRAEAIRIYERCERALSRDMDLEPVEKTKRLYRSIIGG